MKSCFIFASALIAAGASQLACGSSQAPVVLGVAISPSTASLLLGGTQQFTATISGSTDTAVAWSVREGSSGGTVNSTGLYTAPAAAGTYHVVATSHADNTKSASATVTASQAPGVTVTVSPKTVTLLTGASQAFTTAVTNATDLSVAWTVQEGSVGGSVDAGGTYTAPASPGTFHVVATSNADKGKSDSATVTVNTPGPIAVFPALRSVMVGGAVAFNCVVNLPDTACNWSIQEGAGGGSITSAGQYTAPGTMGTYHVIATAHADSSKTATATVTVVAQGTVGSWVNVTPAGFNLNPGAFNNDNYGIQDVLADPARPSDFYFFTCLQGVWKSTDYGQTWKKISTGLDQGKMWTAAIDPNPNRDPATPPTLWSATGDAAVGIWKSTDGGITWTAHTTDNSTAAADCNNSYYANDAYALDVDPYDGKHLLTGFHQCAGLSESTDGGLTWRTVPVPGDMGASVYPFFVNTGTPATTRTTWLMQAQWDKNINGIYRTEDSGAHWQHVAPASEHAHGCSQFYQPGGGVIYAPSVPDGLIRSADLGKTWTQVSNLVANGVYGTSKLIYASYGWATGGNNAPNLQDAALAGTSWTQRTAPGGMTNGAKRVGVSSDGTHAVMVSGNWLAGIWRYVEP